MPRFGTGGTLRNASAVTVVVVATLLLVVPLVVMGRTVWVEGSGHLGEILTSPGLGTAVRNTFALAAVVTAFAVPIGTTIALCLDRPDLPGRVFWRIAMLLPVLVPDFVLGYSWLRAYGRAGFTDDLLHWYWEGVQGPAGVAVVVTVNAVPLAYLTVAVGLAARAEPNLRRAARASGAGGLTALRTVTLPLLRPPMLAASVLVLVLTLGTFAIPQVMGAPAQFSTVTTRIYSDLTRGSDPLVFMEATVLVLLLVVFAVLVVTPADLGLSPRLRSPRTAFPTGAPVAIGSRSTNRWIVVGLGGYLVLTMVLPLLALLAAALTRAPGLPPTVENWTVRNFTSVITARNVEALSRSLVLAASAACLLTVLGGCVAALERRRSGRGIATLVTLTLVLPGSALAIGLLSSYGRWLGATSALILLAYIAKLWAFAHRPISGALDRLPPDELRASRASGATALTAIRTVALRPLAPALAGAWLVCFLAALHEVTMSSLLYGPGGETLAVVVLNSQELGNIGSTAALSVVLTVLTLLPALLLLLVLRGLRAPRRAPQPARPLPMELTHAG
jgi:iron(III) transport system permease protein